MVGFAQMMAWNVITQHKRGIRGWFYSAPSEDCAAILKMEAKFYFEMSE